ncbi:targeting protein for Xklp2 isoform X2 [Brienomyrus brachyistius]|uniref:targeting protein for Xklp2 isoform X2 n=1 Tax=Brienomyrus brachyistius TaxID=42636 RepID=UPI0020B38737|nr:targeting protein for Xklp2 isoform X2 [Brienomyrus brachyistius]
MQAIGLFEKGTLSNLKSPVASNLLVVQFWWCLRCCVTRSIQIYFYFFGTLNQLFISEFFFFKKAVDVPAEMDALQSQSADKYEYDAPAHIIDMKALENEDGADEWFDQKFDTATGGPDQLITPHKSEKPLGGSIKANLPRAVVSPRRKTVNSDTEAAADEHPAASDVPPNIVTSWGNGKASEANLAQPRRVSKRREMAWREEKRKNAAAPGTPPVKKQRRSVAVVPVRRTFHQRRSSSSRSLRRSVSSVPGARRVPQVSKAPGRTKPAASTAIRRAASQKQKSSEQQELEHIAALQKETAEHRKKNEASLKAAMAGSQPAKKPALCTTVPVDFHFRTDERLKVSETPSDATYKTVDFAAQLRKHPSSPAKALRGTTVPKPFNLSAGTKRKFEEAKPFVPMAQMIEQFQTQTPPRYHLRSRQRDEKGPSPVKTEKMKITNPHTPQLMTRQRGRPVAVKSTAELEAEELEKLQQFKFKALELNRKILESALVPKKPAPRDITHPEGFDLEIERRLQARQASKKQEEPVDHTFHSRPLPTRILEEVVGVPEKKVLNPTVPESPAFALKNRVRVEHKVEEVKPAPPIRANPAPHFGLPFQPKLQEMRQVEMCPFSFEAREQERIALKEKRLEEQRREEVRKFKALPLPDFHEVHLPEKKVLEPTKAEPFRLLIDERGAAKSERWELKMKEELKQQAEAANFKARPNAVVHKEPFVPKKENRPALVSDVFQLSTERRAKERQEYDLAMSEKEAQRARMGEQERKEREEKEKEDIARLRHEQVHKAQPIRRYKQLEVKKSEVSLTVPQSPNFSDRFRF